MELILTPIAFALGVVGGFFTHKWAVKEDLLIADKVKELIGKKVAEAKAAAEKK
jgi:hypothetical protein